MKFSFYVADIETTGLDSHTHDVIELSMYQLGNDRDNAQKTWCLKPLNPEAIEPEALRINGHKLEDLLWQTGEGRGRYLEPSRVLVDVENWLADDGRPAANRFLIGQNISFDKERLEQLWSKCQMSDSYPLGRYVMDTMQNELFIDYVKTVMGIGEFAEGYSLNRIIKKYGVKNDKAHSAAADVRATKEVFEKQVEYLKGLLSK